MPSTYSTNLKIELQATGENSGTWGTITNTNLGTALEQAIVGYGNPNYASDANLTLTYTDTNAAQAARALVLNVTSGVSLTGTRELVVPTIQKQYIVQNNTTGSQSITVKTSAGTGITVPNGRKAHLYVDGTNVIYMDDYVDINGGTIDGTTIGANSAAAGTFTTATATTGNITTVNATTVDATNVEVTNVKAKDGTAAASIADSTGVVSITANPILSGGTANGVLYLNGSKVATSGSAVTYDGTTFATTGAANFATSSGNVGIGGTAGASAKVQVLGTLPTSSNFTSSISLSGTIPSGTTNQYWGVRSLPTTQAASFALSELKHFVADPQAFGAGSTVTSQYGFLVESTLTGATNNYGFFSNIASGSNRWNFYANGTANNYFAGNVGIGSTTPGTYSEKLIVASAGSAQASMMLQNPGIGSGQLGIAAASSNLKIYNTYTDGLLANGKGIDIDLNGNVGIGTASPATKLSVAVSGSSDGITVGTGVDGTAPNIYVNGGSDGANGPNIFGRRNGSNEWVICSLRGITSGGAEGLANFVYGNNPQVFYTNSAERMRISGSGNVGIGASAPGATGFTSFLALGNNNAGIGNAGTNIIGIVTNNAERMRIDSSGNVGIGGTAPGYAKTSVQGTLPTSNNISISFSSEATVPSGATSLFAGFYSAGSTQAASFTLTNYQHFRVWQNGFGAGSTVTNQYGYYVDSNMTSATNNYGFYSNIASGSNRWNFYANGTAANYFAGLTSVGTTVAGGFNGTFVLGGSGSPTSGYLEGIHSNQLVPSSVTTRYDAFLSSPSTASASFTVGSMRHYAAQQGTFNSPSAVTSQFGFYVDSTLTGATNNFGFYSDIASGSNRWNFYAAGTARNYFAGNIGVGADSAVVRVFARGANTASSDYVFYGENSDPTLLFYVRNDGIVNTGVAANSPYNYTTGSAANLYVDNAGVLYRSTSSLRYKTDVTNAAHGLADVLKLRSVTYKGKNDGETVFGGLIAEEVHDAGLTEFVAYDKEGRPDALHYGNMVALLVKAVQELKAELDALKAV